MPARLSWKRQFDVNGITVHPGRVSSAHPAIYGALLRPFGPSWSPAPLQWPKVKLQRLEKDNELRPVEFTESTTNSVVPKEPTVRTSPPKVQEGRSTPRAGAPVASVWVRQALALFSSAQTKTACQRRTPATPTAVPERPPTCHLWHYCSEEVVPRASSLRGTTGSTLWKLSLVVVQQPAGVQAGRAGALSS